MRGCATCRALERKILLLEDQLAAQQRQLGLKVSTGKIIAVMAALGVEPAQARILIRLHRTGESFTAAKVLISQMHDPDADPSTIRTQVCRMRRSLGKDFIETGAFGMTAYRLSEAALHRVAAAMAGA